MISPRTRSLIRKAIEEDLGRGDVTSEAFIPKSRRGGAVIFAKESGILAGAFVAAEVFRLKDPSLGIRLLLKEGVPLKKGAEVLRVTGRLRSILIAERTALNFLGHLSGIATLTRAYVERVKGTQAKIFDTRKTTPLWRALEKGAVRSGGGENHRFGLWDEILVKENHWAAVGPPGLLAMTASRREIPVEVEVTNLKELAHLLEGPFVPDRILLDNFSVKELRRAVLFVKGLDYVLRNRYGIRRRTAGAGRALPLLEASGGVTLENVRKIAQTGVDRISVGRLTHSAPALDFSLKLVC